MKNTLMQSLNVSNTYLPGTKGDVHNTPLMAQGNVLSTNTTRLADKIISSYFATDVSSDLQGDKDRKSSAHTAVSNPTPLDGVGGVKALASKPVYSINGDKVVVTTFYYLPGKDQSLSYSSINSLGEVLSKLFKQPVELRLVRLHYPYLNAHILAQYIAMNTRKYNFTRIQRAIFNAVKSVRIDGSSDSSSQATLLPAYITGIKIKISGRLATERSVPRQTEKTAQIGTFSNSSSSSSNVVEYSQFTSKNKKGAFTVKVWISQVAHTS